MDAATAPPRRACDAWPRSRIGSWRLRNTGCGLRNRYCSLRRLGPDDHPWCTEFVHLLATMAAASRSPLKPVVGPIEKPCSWVRGAHASSSMSTGRATPTTPPMCEISASDGRSLAGADRIKVEHRSRHDGADLTYTTDDPLLITARRPTTRSTPSENTRPMKDECRGCAGVGSEVDRRLHWSDGHIA